MRELLDTVLAEVRGMWRFRWWGIALAWAVCVGGVLYVYLLPDIYKAQARVNVDTQSMLRPLLQGIAVQPDVQTQVRLMTNTLLSRPNVEKIARETDLMLQADTPEEEQEVVDRLSDAISLAGDPKQDIYTISYSSASPERAQEVVRTTLDILMEDALGSTRQDSTGATQFLQKQVNEYEQRLQKAEQDLAQFKRENSGLLPSQEGGYYQTLSQANQQMSNLEAQLDTARSRKQSMSSEIEAMENGQAPNSAQNPRVQQLDAQIQSNMQRLNDLLLQYTDQHPDVIAMRDRLDRLRSDREEALKNGGGSPSDLSTNPVYQNLQISLNETNSEIASLQSQIARQQKRIDELKRRGDQMTQVEAQLTNLTRTYDVTKQRYQELLTRLNSAKISSDADASGGQVQFRVIDPPVMPYEPAGPPRIIYLLFVLVLSLGAGAGLALFLSQIKPVFMDRRSLAEVTGRPVLGTVSLVMSHTQTKAAKSAVAAFALATAGLVMVVALGVVFADSGANVVRSMLGGTTL